MRGEAIERYTVDEIVKTIQQNGAEDDVDLVSGGRTVLFFSEEERLAARADYDAAKSAGAQLDDVEWLTKDESREVSILHDVRCKQNKKRQSLHLTTLAHRNMEPSIQQYITLHITFGP